MGFPFYEEQRITVTVLLFAVSSSSGEVDLSVTFDTRDVMFCTFVAIQSFFSSTEEKDGMFCTVWQQRVFFAISKKDYNIFDDAQRFSSIKIKVIFCFFASKSAPPWSIFESSWTNGSRTLLKYKYWSSFFFSQKDQVLMSYCCHSLDINAQVSGYPQTSTRNLSLSSRSNYLPAHIFLPDNLQTESLRSTVFFWQRPMTIYVPKGVSFHCIFFHGTFLMLNVIKVDSSLWWCWCNLIIPHQNFIQTTQIVWALGLLSK